MHPFINFLRRSVAFLFVFLSIRRRSTSGRLVGLLVSMAILSAALFLPILHIVAFEQMLYFAGERGEQICACVCDVIP